MITHLISTTDFVKLIHNKRKDMWKGLIQNGKNYISLFDIIVRYANFISQKPTLSMFVICDEGGNILEEPKLEHYQDCDNETNMRDYLYNLDNYREKQSKILFKGWEHMVYSDGTIWIRQTTGGNNCWYYLDQYKTLEDLPNLNKLELTGEALKEIGL